MKIRALFLGVGICVLSTSSVWADNPSVNKRPRMQSMGGAGVAVQGDRDSALMNPAALADIEETEWQIFPILFEVPFDLDVLSSALDFNDARGGNATTAEKQAALDDFLRDASTTATRTRFNLYPSYTSNWWGAGVHIGLLMEALVDADFALNGFGANRVINTQGTAATGGLILGAGYGFLENTLQVGMTLKPLYRHGIFEDGRISTLELAQAQNENNSFSDNVFGDDAGSRGAFGVGVDFGVKYWLQDYGWGETYSKTIEFLKPAVGLTYQDVGNTRFFTNNEQPEDIEQSLSVGLAFHPELAFTKNTIAFDFRNVNEKQVLWNKLHFGLESLLWDFWAIRFGVGQGYVSGGMGLDIPFFELDIYVSAEEAGHKARLQDRRTLGIRLSAAL